MKLSIKGLALAILQMMASAYPGYHATRSVAEVIVGTSLWIGGRAYRRDSFRLALQSVC
jgi:hypothetical protein